ncbi:hypothetical protein KAT42_03065, partial [Candidatus Bathyarchaeota archaeon]|nr:hypothetical protein [Candidatus Bathyarchaeota archaeon]
VLLGHSLQSVAGSAYYSLLMQTYTTVDSPPVILENGTVGASTIYTNKTCAKTSVSGYGYDSVDHNDTDVDSSADKGIHSNFTAQKYGPDLINDTLTELLVQKYQIRPTSFTDPSDKWIDETNAWDWNNATSASETQGRVENNIYWTTWNNSGSGGVTDVDLRIRIDLTGLVDDYVTVQWWVGSTQGTGTYEINSTNDGTDLNISFNDLSEPNDGLWSWTDIGNIEIRQVGTKTATNDSITCAVDEVWGWVNAGSGSVNHELDLEVQWTNVDFDETYEELCIKTGAFSGSEDIRVDAWNVSTSDWHFLYNLIANSWNNVSVTDWLNNENFTARFLGGTESGDTSQDSWNIDVTLLHIWTVDTYDYDHVLKINNTVTVPWQIRLKKYADSNINRLENCTIYFHNSTDGASNQIYIQNGVYINQTGPWYDLGGSETIYIAMTAQANSTGTSYVHVYLEILTSGTTTYAQYVIAFEIT